MVIHAENPISTERFGQFQTKLMCKPRSLGFMFPGNCQWPETGKFRRLPCRCVHPGNFLVYGWNVTAYRAGHQLVRSGFIFRVFNFYVVKINFQQVITFRRIIHIPASVRFAVCSTKLLQLRIDIRVVREENSDTGGISVFNFSDGKHFFLF